MSAAKNAAGVLLAFMLVLASFPWVLWAAGYMMRGDMNGATRVLDRAPFTRWLDYVEGRRAE